jgi:anti-anti-sigma regulatory factor
MTLRIEYQPRHEQSVFLLIGRITAAEVPQLQASIAAARKPVALDLTEVLLVDVDAVRFLAEAEDEGIELRHLRPYVRAWILLEQAGVGEFE